MRSRASRLYAVLVIAGVGLLPLVSRAFFPAELRKIHEESIEQRDSEREQFRQDVLEKRKEMLAKWHDKKEEFRNRLKVEQEKIASQLEVSRKKGIEIHGTSTASVMEAENGTTNDDIVSVIKKGVKNFAHALFPFSHLFRN